MVAFRWSPFRGDVFCRIADYTRATTMGVVFHSERRRRASSGAAPLGGLLPGILDQDWRTWRQLLVIAAALALSAFLAQRPSFTLLGGLVGLGGLFALLRWPSLGPLTIVVAANLVPFGIGTGTET